MLLTTVLLTTVGHVHFMYAYGLLTLVHNVLLVSFGHVHDMCVYVWIVDPLGQSIGSHLQRATAFATCLLNRNA